MRLHEHSNTPRLWERYGGAIRSGLCLADNVRCLTIDGFDTNTRDEPPEQHDWVNTHSTVALLENLSNVEELDLEGIVWSNLNTTTQNAILGNGRVQVLRLVYCDFPDPGDLVRLLQSFPRLRELHDQGSSVGEDKDFSDALRDNVETLTLDRMYIGGSCADVCLHWAYAGRTEVFVKRLDVVWDREEPFPVQLCKGTGFSIESLYLTLKGSAQSEANITRVLSVDQDTQLRNVSLHLRQEDYCSHIEQGTCCLSGFVKQLSSRSNLRRVCIMLDVKDEQASKFVDWDYIDGTLVELQTLDSVEVGVFPEFSAGGKGNRSHLNDVPLPRLRDRGILVILQ